MAEKHRKKLYQVDYTVQSAKHLMGSQDKEVGQVASILGMYLGLVSDTHSPPTDHIVNSPLALIDVVGKFCKAVQ